jgi:hypothetical protein
MAELIVYKGSKRIRVSPGSDSSYLYQIGSGQVEGGSFIGINDSRRLNILAQEIRDDYSLWVYSLNDLFLEASLKTNNLSLFFLTDLSCKRSEFFETFDYICSLLLIREGLNGVELTRARLIGLEPGFERAFRSMFPTTTVITIDPTPALARPWRRLGADALFLFRAAGALFVNASMKKNLTRSQSAGRTFFSIYPQMFSKDGVETKYGEFPDKKDNYAVSILTDGMHQKTSITDYGRWCREAEKRGFGVIDRYLAISDLASGLYWLSRLWLFFFSQRDRAYVFKGIDISGLTKMELLFSISRVMRLWIMRGALERFLNITQVRELVYYPCEYPLGRMISFVVESCRPAVLRTGFQMSIASQRRLEQFLAPGEGTPNSPFLEHAPIPDRVLAENSAAASIYRQAGYQNVEIMDSIYRFEYLEGIAPEKQVGWVLIAPGLHDGAMMLEQLRNEMAAHPRNTYLIKAHPRADNRYLACWSSTENLQVSIQPLAELLAIVSQVFVTYSSVGVEAKHLGIDVRIIDIPGRVNTSPLLDFPN